MWKIHFQRVIHPFQPDTTISTVWGLLNAFETVSRVEAPWQVLHLDVDGVETGVTEEELYEGIIFVPPGLNLPTGTYLATMVRITRQVTNIFPPGTQIQDAWGRPSSADGYDLNQNLATAHTDVQEYIFDFEPLGNEIDVTAQTFTWRIDNLNPAIPVFYLPGGYTSAAEVSIPYTVHLFDGSVSNSELTDGVKEVNLMPNPTEGGVLLSFRLEGAAATSIELFDLTGRRVFFQKMTTFLPEGYLWICLYTARECISVA